MQATKLEPRLDERPDPLGRGSQAQDSGAGLVDHDAGQPDDLVAKPLEERLPLGLGQAGTPRHHEQVVRNDVEAGPGVCPETAAWMPQPQLVLEDVVDLLDGPGLLAVPGQDDLALPVEVRHEGPVPIAVSLVQGQLLVFQRSTR